MTVRKCRDSVWLCLLLTGLLAQVPASAQDKPARDIAGIWQGTLNMSAGPLRLVFDFKMKEGGGFTGTMDSPDQGVFGLPIDEVTVAEKTVKFTMKLIAGSYEGKVSADGKQIDGRWTQPGVSRMLVLKPGIKIGPPTRSLPQIVKVDSQVLDSYVGQYELAPKMLLILRRERQHLLAQLTGQSASEVFSESETKFFWKIVDAQFTITKDEVGNVTGLLFEQASTKINAKRISSELPKVVELAEPEETIESPRLVALVKELNSGNRGAIAKFWDDMRDKSPLVEPMSGQTGKSLVTFLWRGDERTRRVCVNGGLPTVDGDKWLARLPDTDLWYRTERIPNDARFAYGFLVNRPLKMPRSNDLAGLVKLMELCPSRLDPLNPRDATLQGMLSSVVELPDAPPQPWVERLPDARKGELKEQKIKSELLEGEQNVTIYTPADYDPKGEECGLLVLFDGTFYQDPDMIPGPVILDNLIAKKKIPPLVAVFVKHEGASRNKDLSCSQPFADFVAKELVPWVAEYRVSADPKRAIVGGLSLGGLMASYCGLRHTNVFGNVLSQSGSYWWFPGALEQDDRELPKLEPGWLSRQYITASKRVLRFYLDDGRFEDGGGYAGLAESRRFRDVLLAKGYTVHHSPFSGGHDYLSWRGSLADALIVLTGPVEK